MLVSAWGWGGVEPLTKFFKRGRGRGLTGAQLLERGLLGMRLWLFSGGGGELQFLDKKTIIWNI